MGHKFGLAALTLCIATSVSAGKPVAPVQPTTPPPIYQAPNPTPQSPGPVMQGNPTPAPIGQAPVSGVKKGFVEKMALAALHAQVTDTQFCHLVWQDGRFAWDYLTQTEQAEVMKCGKDLSAKFTQLGQKAPAAKHQLQATEYVAKVQGAIYQSPTLQGYVQQHGGVEAMAQQSLDYVIAYSQTQANAVSAANHWQPIYPGNYIPDARYTRSCYVVAAVCAAAAGNADQTKFMLERAQSIGY